MYKQLSFRFLITISFITLFSIAMHTMELNSDEKICGKVIDNFQWRWNYIVWAFSCNTLISLRVDYYGSEQIITLFIQFGLQMDEIMMLKADETLVK